MTLSAAPQRSHELPELLAIVELLGELTADAERLPEIPRLLVSVLPLDRADLSLVRLTPEAEVAVVASSYERNQEASPRSVPDSDETAGAVDADAGTCAPDAGRANQRFEYARQLDSRHRLTLILHWSDGPPALTAACAPRAEAVCESLARSIRLLLAWRDQPALLGGPFSDITGAQWRVLRQLGSDLSEKQLAHSLEISPHTLHCHIKSIYQKLRVRSRLGALRLLHQAVRQFRARTFAWSRGKNGSRAPDAAWPLPDTVVDRTLPQNSWNSLPIAADDPARSCEPVPV